MSHADRIAPIGTGISAAPEWATPAIPDIWMTGDPKVGHTDCVAFCPADPVWTDQGWCEGVMIEVHFGLDLEIRICRHHLDLFADMIIHTRQLKEREIARAGPEAAT